MCGSKLDFINHSICSVAQLLEMVERESLLGPQLHRVKMVVIACKVPDLISQVRRMADDQDEICLPVDSIDTAHIIP